jgi:hypothetical protein
MQKAIDQQFFSEHNEQNLFGVVAQDFEKKMGSRLSRQQTNRLARTLEHYMQEIWDVNGPLPIQQLNREAISATAKDFTSYLRRNEIAPTFAASEKIVTDPANQPRMEVAQQRLLQQQGMPVQPRPTFESNLLMDTGSRFEQLQQDRVPPAPARPSVPDFQISLTASGDEQSALSLYEQAKKMRDAEASRVQQEAQRLAGVATAIGTAQTDVNPLMRFMNPPSIQNDAQSNPTIAQPIAAMASSVRGPLPQDYLIKQDDIINYKETEYNLVLYSADRDWLNSTKENRYNFSVIFDPANNKQGFTLQPSTNKKFKNISRIELVKAILPSEGFDPLIKYISTVTSPTAIPNSDSKINVLSYPYILVRIPELDTNNYGTDNNIDNSFAMLQYDANWYTDTTNVSDGYLGMIPKFMKCQKVYEPTPLATLTKLTIELQTPAGIPLSVTPDTLTIQNIYISGNVPAGTYNNGYYRNILDNSTATNGTYYIIRTTTFFNKWLFQPGNRIQLKGLNPSQVNTAGSTLASQQFIDYLQSEEGLVIVQIGNTVDPSGGGDGPISSTGYANLIIVRALMQDPTTGSDDAVGLGTPSYTNIDLATNLKDTTFTGAKLINLTHQTSVVLRIITRDLDPAARVRPDNL